MEKKKIHCSLTLYPKINFRITHSTRIEVGKQEWMTNSAGW